MPGSAAIHGGVEKQLPTAAKRLNTGFVKGCIAGPRSGDKAIFYNSGARACGGSVK